MGLGGGAEEEGRLNGEIRGAAGTYYEAPLSEHQFSTQEKFSGAGAEVGAGGRITDVINVVAGGSAVGGGISLRVKVAAGAVSEVLLAKDEGGGGSVGSL